MPNTVDLPWWMPAVTEQRPDGWYIRHNVTYYSPWRGPFETESIAKQALWHALRVGCTPGSLVNPFRSRHNL